MIDNRQLRLIKVNHGSMSHLDKDCVNMKIDHGDPWSNMGSHSQSLLTLLNHG